jgi:ABC-type enterobactin transport system permease subunit
MSALLLRLSEMIVRMEAMASLSSLGRGLIRNILRRWRLCRELLCHLLGAALGLAGRPLVAFGLLGGRGGVVVGLCIPQISRG